MVYCPSIAKSIKFFMNNVTKFDFGCINKWYPGNINHMDYAY